MRPANWSFPLVFSVVVATAIGLPAQERTDGTYEFWICRGSCQSASDTNVFAAGRFVVLTDSISRRMFDSTAVVSRAPSYRPGARACFVFLLQRPTRVRSYAGIEEAGLTSWGQGNLDQLNIMLFASVDAFYNVQLVRQGNIFRGVGKSLGQGVSREAGFADDSVEARRVGPANLSDCTRAPAPQRPTDSALRLPNDAWY